MSRSPDPAKLREWSDRFQRFEKASQTVAEFCRAEAVSQPSFYHWRRRLAGGGRRRQRVKGGQRSARRASSSRGFRSVVVTPPASVASVKVRLPDGVVIELGDDPQVVQRVVSQLLDRQAGTGGKGC